MSQLTINRISNVLEAQFASLVDMSDWDGRPDADKRTCFLQRALAALCIKILAKVTLEVAAASITDGFHDGGIDALFFDQKADTFFLVQAKWNENGNKPLDPESMNSFVAGAKDLLAGRLERFNAKVQSKEAEIKAVLYSARNTRIVFVTAHTALQASPTFATRKLDDLLLELNNPVECASRQEYDQAGVYKLITAESTKPEIQLQIVLNDWGVIERPYLAYYGKVHVSAIAQWWADYGNSLFSQNLRLFYTNSAVNDAVRHTILNSSENFWYFNNGITLICNNINKGLAGAPGRQVGLFTCEGISIVNGAQTVGTIGQASNLSPSLTEEDAANSYVQVRIIALSACPPEFSQAITRAANLQNAVGYREFAAMDPIQQSLAIEFALDRKKYVYKQGEPDPHGEEGCSIVEATQALGCAHSVNLAVQVKKEIGNIWANTDVAPYTELFNEKLSSKRLWQDVRIMRQVDDELQPLRTADVPRADMICVHLNRVILYLVFQDQAVVISRNKGDLPGLLQNVKNSVATNFKKISEYVQKNHEYEYLASLCKNLGKCEKMVQDLDITLVEVEESQGSLF